MKARLRAAIAPAASWQWTDMLPAEGSVDWNRPDRYALRVVGDAMEPRYRSGDYLIVNAVAPPEAGYDALVVLKDGTAMIRELASVRDGQVALRGPNGSRRTIAEAVVQFMHRIVGRADASEVFHAAN